MCTYDGYLRTHFCPKNLVLSLLERECDYEISWGPEPRSQFSIPHRGRNKQMEIEPINFRDILESFLDPWCRVFCFKDFSSGFSIYSREAKPIQQRRCFSGIMEGP